jgi:amidase
VVGFKPTVGLVSRTGVVPIAHTHDTAGPITRTVADAALLLSAMAGPDPADPSTDAIPGGLDLDFVAQLSSAPLSGVRLGYALGFVAQFSPAEQDLFDASLTRLEEAGATLVPIVLPTGGGLNAALLTVLTTELKADLNAYLLDHATPGVPATLADIIAFNEANAAEVMPHFGQEWFIQAEATTGLDDPDYLDARDQLLEETGPQGLLPVLDDDDLDAIVLPTTGPAWTTNYATGDAGTPSSAFLPAAAGYPHLTVPMGEVSGLPVGISFIGRPFEDATVLAVGHGYEQLD